MADFRSSSSQLTKPSFKLESAADLVCRKSEAVEKLLLETEESMPSLSTRGCGPGGSKSSLTSCDSSRNSASSGKDHDLDVVREWPRGRLPAAECAKASVGREAAAA